MKYTFLGKTGWVGDGGEGVFVIVVLEVIKFRGSECCCVVSIRFILIL